MTTPNFGFIAHPDQNLLEIHLSGLWSVATVDAYEDARRRAFRDMAERGCPPEATLVLVDRRQQTVQPAEVVTKLSALVTNGPTVRKTAVIVDSILHKMQAGRIGDPSVVSVFLARDEALAWLLRSDK